jgi:hypothetical protein
MKKIRSDEMADMNKPFMEMDPVEFRDTWDELGKPLNKGILDEARESKEGVVQSFAVAVLGLADGTKRVAHYWTEYGDGEAEECASEWVEECKREHLLKDGESLSSAVVVANLLDLWEAHIRSNRTINARFLDEARDPKEGGSQDVAFTVLMLADGTKRVAHYWPEYGDGEGRRQAYEWVEECKRGGLLQDGESLSFTVADIALRDALEKSL